MALKRKQQLIHLHGSSKGGLQASDFNFGELLILHAADGHAEFGTRVGDTLRWAPDQETIVALIKKSLSGIQADAVTSVSGDAYVSASKTGNTVTLTTDVVTDFNGEIGEDKKLADAQAIKTYVDGLNTAASGEIDAIIAKLGTGFTSGSTATSQLANVKATADAALKSISGENAIVVATGESQNVNVTLKIDTGNTKGNVELVNGENGLSAKVAIPEDNVLGVKEGDKVLALGEDKKLTATISFSVDTTDNSDGKKYLRLKGIGGADLGKVDIADFVKDGMLNEAELVTITKKDEKYVYGSEDTVANGVVEEGEYIKLVWNADSGKNDPMFVNVSKLVDTYTAKDSTLTLNDHAFSVNTEVIAAVGTSGDTKNSNTLAGAKKYADDAVATAKKNIDAYTVNGKVISGNPTLSGEDINVASSGETKTVKAAIDELYTQVGEAKVAGVTTFGGKTGDIVLKESGTANGTINLTMSDKTLQAEIVGLSSAAFTKSTDYDKAGAATAVLGTSADTKTNNTVYGVQAYVKEVEQALTNKNVTAGVPEGETLVNADANANKVTVSSTEALKTAVTKAGSAVQDVKVDSTEANKITVAKAADNIVTINIDNMIIDCGEF